MTDRPDFPQAIDSTMRSAYKSCAKKFELEYLWHWASSEESVHLVAGAAFARGLEVARQLYWDEGWRDTEAILTEASRELLREYGGFEPPEDSPKHPSRMIDALHHCFENYGWSGDYIQPWKGANRHIIEFKFGLPIDVQHPQTGNPIIYCGRFDMIGKFQDQPWVVDDKTSGSLGGSWTKQWDMRGQITGYCWAAQMYGIPVAGAILRGTGILKTKITHAESIQYRPPEHIKKWYRQLCIDVERMIQDWRNGYFDYDFADACSAYGGCQFVPVCSSIDEERTLQNHYTTRVWEPLKVARLEETEDDA